MITLYLATALLCFQDNCYPVLVGKDTPVGEFSLVERLTEDKGYGGNVLQFYEDEHKVYAIHRVWLMNPKEHRDKRLQSDKVSDRVITKGCINVGPMVFDLLKQCCMNEKLRIVKHE